MNNIDMSHMSHAAKTQAKALASQAKQTGLKLAAAANLPTSMPATNKEWQRVVLWSFWAVNMIIDIVYIGMSFATSTRLSKHIDVTFNVNYNTWRAPIAATVLGPLMVLVFNIMSCVILIRKSVNRSGPSFGYGFIMAWAFMMAFYCLLCGLILDSFSTDALSPSVSGNVTDITGQPVATSSGWTAYYSQVYHGTVVLNYICCGLFLIFFLAFVVFQGGISKHLNMYDAKTDRKRQLELAAVARAAQQASLAAGGGPSAYGGPSNIGYGGQGMGSGGNPQYGSQSGYGGPVGYGGNMGSTL